MGERAAGPMAKRMTSPHPGAFAPAIGRPKIATDAFPASSVPMTQGAASTRATPIASAATTRSRQPALARSDQHGAQRPGQRRDDDHRHDGGSEGRRRGDDGAEDGDLARRAAAPPRAGLDPVRRHTGGAGQAQRDEGKRRIGHQAVPASRAQRTVGQREPEVADDGDETGPRRDDGAHEARDTPGAEGDAPEQQDSLQRPHRAEQDGPREADEAEGG